MKITRITREKDLKAGPYIRAVINCQGRFWIEYQILTGKPFNCKSKSSTGSRMMSCKEGTGHYNGGGVLHTTTLSEDLNVNFKKYPKAYMTVLIPYSNKVWNYLKGIKDVRDFAEVTNGVRPTDEQHYRFLSDCECQRLSDTHFHEQMMRDYAYA
jgi:hypothetical protein